MVAELLLSKVLDVTVIKDIVLELLLTTIFVAFNWFGGGTIGLLAYLLSYLVYLFLKRNELRAIWDSQIVNAVMIEELPDDIDNDELDIAEVPEVPEGVILPEE